MRYDTETEPLDFMYRFLRINGAAVERSGSALEALIPEELRPLLNIPEHIRISGQSEDTPDSAAHYTAAYGAPMLEQMMGKTLASVPVTGCRLEFDYIKSGGFARLLEEQITFYGAKTAIETVAEVMADYLLVACRYTAQSDEQKEGLLTMVFNKETGGLVPDMGEALDSARGRADFSVPGPKAREMIVPLSDSIEQTARRLLADRLEPFRARMNRRFQRDIENLREYYASLEQEMRHNLEKPGLSDSARSDRQAKIESIPSELASKKDDLFKKYSIRVGLQPAAAMHIRTPAKKLACRLSIGRQTRQFFLTYNPVTRKLDPPPCSRCRTPSYNIHFNSRLAPVCFACREK